MAVCKILAQMPEKERKEKVMVRERVCVRESDPVAGVWGPKQYAGTYGTNGFKLTFSDNSGTTSTTLGKDSSGNGLRR